MTTVSTTTVSTTTGPSTTGPSTTGPVRVAIVMDHPAQQFAGALRLLAAEPLVRLRVCYGSVAGRSYDPGFSRPVRWDTDLLGGYQWAAPGGRGRGLALARWLEGQFRALRPRVVVCYGWASPVARSCILACLLSRRPLLLYGDSTWQHSSRDGTGNQHRGARGSGGATGGLTRAAARGAARSAARSLALRALMKLSAGAISTGTFNREFYIWHGMDPRRIWPGVCPADTDAFAVARPAGRSRAAGPDCQHLRQGDSPLRIGFAGKLIPRKGPDELLRAVGLLPPGTRYCVTVVGDGPMLPELRGLAGRLGLADRVRFAGFANTTQMPGLLAGCDVVVVPSRRDMRALVTIEAMAAGAAVVVSDATAVWGPGDLVQHEVTGLVYPSGDERALAAALSRLAADPALLARLRDAGARRAAGYGPDAFARTMAAAVTRGPGRPPGRGDGPPGTRP